MSADRQRFDRLLPWYPTSSLAPADRTFVEGFASRDESARAALDWHRDLAGVVSARAERKALQVPELVGWAGLEARLRAERQAQVAPARASIRGRLAAGIESLLAMLTQRPAYALAAALIAAQGIVIGTLLQQPADTGREYSSVRGVERPARTVLQIRFKPSTTEPALRDLLYRAGARIIDGPDQLGDYVVAPRRGSIAELAGALTDSPLVQNVNTVRDWKPNAEGDEE